MKRLFVGLLCFGFAGAAHGATVSGTLAQDLMEISEAVGATEGAAGHVVSDLKDVSCVKNVDGVDDFISCSGQNPNFESTGAGATFELSTKDPEQKQNAIKLRNILIEVVGGEVKTAATRKVITVARVQCRALSSAFILDDIDLEPTATCEMTE